MIVDNKTIPPAASLLSGIEAGILPPALAELLSPFACDTHEAHIETLARTATYPVCGLEIAVAPGLYHPHPASSSMFILRTLLRENIPLGQLLELGCGSGVLSLALLKQGLAEQAVLLDIDATAIATAQSNARQAGLDQRTRILQGNLFAPVANEKFDSILFNLPLMHQSHQGATHQALDDTGGAVAERFFQEVPRYLNTGGSVYFSYSNISDAALLASFSQRHPVRLLAAEWVASTGFWLLVYQARLTMTGT